MSSTHSRTGMPVNSPRQVLFASLIGTTIEFFDFYIYATAAAQVIGSSGSQLSRLFTVDKGEDYHLKPDMAVITGDGIVGKVRDVFPHTAQVLAINDQSSGAGVILETTRVRGIKRQLDVLRLRASNATDHLAGGRRYVFEIAALDWRNPIPADEVLIARTQRNAARQIFQVGAERVAELHRFNGLMSDALELSGTGGTH